MLPSSRKYLRTLLAFILVLALFLIGLDTFFFLREGREMLDLWLERVPSRWVEKILSLFQANNLFL